MRNAELWRLQGCRSSRVVTALGEPGGSLQGLEILSGKRQGCAGAGGLWVAREALALSPRLGQCQHGAIHGCHCHCHSPAQGAQSGHTVAGAVMGLMPTLRLVSQQGCQGHGLVQSP